MRPDGWSWALLFVRWILGLMFLMAGFFKVFDLGASVHAQRYFVEAYAQSWIPEWLLWSMGTAIPYVELVAGGAMCLGFRTRPAALALGVVLVMVTYGHLLKEPFFGIGDQILPRLVLLVFVLVAPADRDVAGVDYWLDRRREDDGE